MARMITAALTVAAAAAQGSWSVSWVAPRVRVVSQARVHHH